MITFKCLKEIIGSHGLVVIGNEVDSLLLNEDVLSIDIENESHKTNQVNFILGELILHLDSIDQNNCILLNGLSKVFLRCEFDQRLIESTLQKLKVLSEFYEVIFCVALDSDIETNIVSAIDESNSSLIDVLFRKQYIYQTPEFMIADDGYYPCDGWLWCLR